MKLTNQEWLRAGRWMGLFWIAMSLTGLGTEVLAQGVGTTTVQGTVYLANGQPGSGTVVVSWPSFTTAGGQMVAADSTTVTIAPDGFVSVNLAPNLGATPAGQYYTAVYYLSDGTTNTQYWVVPAAAQASLAQVQAQLMPAAQAVQAVSKAYVDQSISELSANLVLVSGSTMTGPLTLCCDPTQPLQASDKHYVDDTFALAVPLAGGSMTGALATPAVNGVESPAAGSSQTTLQATMGAAGTNGAVEIPPTYAGSDGFTNPNGVYVADLRQGSSQQFERSVKEFGAVCDGATDDTNALQSALNYAQTHGVALTIPQGTCKTRTLIWNGESIGGMGKQVSALMGFPGQDVLLTTTDAANFLSSARIHDLTIYLDQSADTSCSAAKGLAPAGSCGENRPMESNSIFSPGGNGLTGTLGTGTAWAVGNCAIAMPASTGTGGNGLKMAEIENLEIAATGVDPMAAQYPGAHSTHTCGMYLAQWPQWSEFRNIDIRGLNTGIAIPALPGTTPAGLNSDSNRWENITIQATHGFTAAAGSNNVLDNVVVMAGNSAATGEPPTGLVLDLAGTQQGWTVRNSVVLPTWDAVQPALTVSASGGAVIGVTLGSQAGLGFDPYGTQVPLVFSGSCTAQATANVTSGGTIGAITVTQRGVGCSGTTTASVNVTGTWDTAAPVNLIGGQNMTFYGGNLLKGNGGYTVWNAAGSGSYGTQFYGGGGKLPGGGSYAALITNAPLGNAYDVSQFPGADFGAKLQACLSALNSSYGGTCDARNFTGAQAMGSNLTISTANATVELPCATISTANQVVVTAGTRNVTLRGCALRGASTASGSQGGTLFMYSGTGAMIQVGDPTYAADTMGFHLDNVAINTTRAASGARGVTAYRTQEMDIESLYFLGNSNQTGITLDGTGNYTGGTFLDNEFTGFQTAVNAIGHQVTNPATTDWMNASTFVRLHIDCPTSGGNPIAGTYGINLQQGDGNTFTGGDVEGCFTALHLGANAQNNTIVGLRNENSTNQVVADAGSSYNNWMAGGTMFTGALTDNGTRNSFLDTFHRSFNGLNGDWYGSQKDATVTNHYRLGIGTGNERGLLDRYQTDYGYRWTMGLSDATAGEQYYQILDELNNVNRISVGQYNNGQSSTNNQTVINAAGTGAVVLNGSNNSGTGGVVIGSGGASETTVATINNAGNAQFNGTLQVNGTTTFAGTPTVKNQADTEIDSTLWAGLTASQKESFIYKDWNGNSQWYMLKDQSNNWMLNSATGGLDSFKAYQSTNSGDTYVNASNASGTVRINYEPGSGTAFNIYGGNNSSLYASFTGTAAIKFPGLAASSGHYCLQIDNSGYITNTGATCGTGNTNGTINVGTSGAIAYYSGNGTALSPLSSAQTWTNLFSTAGVNASCALLTTNGAGGLSCASYTAGGALTNLGGLPVSGGAMIGPLNLNTDPTSESQAATKNYSDLHGGAVINATQEFNCFPLTAAQYASWQANPLDRTGATVPTGPGGTAVPWTDQTACVQAAINYGQTPASPSIWWYSESTLMFEPGTYLIGNPTTEGLVESYGTLMLSGNGIYTTEFQATADARVESAAGTAYIPVVASPHQPAAWSPTTAYVVNQLASRNSGTYIALTANTGVDPYFDNGTTWVEVYGRMIDTIKSPSWTAQIAGTNRGGIENLNLQGGPATTDLFYSEVYPDSDFRIDHVDFIGYRDASGNPYNTTNAFKGPVWLNFHLSHSRFDTLGGYATAFVGFGAITHPISGAGFSTGTGTLDFIDDTYASGNGSYNYTSGDGIFFADTTIPLQATVTHYSFSSGVATLTTTTQSYQAGQLVYIAGMTSGTSLNGASYKLLSTGLSSTQFEVACASCANGSGSDSGRAIVRTVIGSNTGVMGTVNWLNGRIEIDSVLNLYYTSAQTSCSVASPAVNCLQRSLFRFLQTDNPLNGPPLYGSYPLLTVTIDGSPMVVDGYSANSPQSNFKIISSDVGEIGGGLTASTSGGIDEEKNNDSGTDTEAVPLAPYWSENYDMVAPYGGAYTGANQGLNQIGGVDIATLHSSAMSNAGYFKTGTLVINKDSIAGTASPAITQVSCPSAGAGMLGSPTVQAATGTMTAGSNILILSALVDAGLTPMHGITVAGAGASGAALPANILFKSDNGLTLILDTAATTSVSGAVISNTQCSLVPAIQSASLVNGAAVPTLAPLTGTNSSGQITLVSTLPAPAEPQHTGDVSNASGSLTMTVKGINGTTLSNLATGLLKNTGSTGTPTIAVAGTDYAAPSSVVSPTAPSWLQYLGKGSSGAITCTGNLAGIQQATTFTVPYGATCTLNNNESLTVHATGACTIAGTLNAAGVVAQNAYGNSGGGGGGGGTAAGSAGGGSFLMPASGLGIGNVGSAGSAGGGPGGTGSSFQVNFQWQVTDTSPTDGQFLGGSNGGAGGSSGGAAGYGGGGVTLICASITGTDGTHTGTINASGGAGGNAPANNTGAGGGGAGGVAILSSQAPVTVWPTIITNGGAGGTCGSFTGCGVGGSGGAGWSAEFQGW